MSIKFRPITHIITGTAPVNPWPPTGTYALCARLYTNTFLDHITVNTVSWNYDSGSSPTYSDANCTQVLSDLSSWNDYSANTVLQTSGQNEYGTYVDIFTDGSYEDADDFCVILGNDRRQTITDDSWKITRVEVYKVGMSNGIYRVNDNPSKGQWFRDRSDWTEFPLTPSSSTIFRPISIFENIPEPPFPYQTVQIGNQTWMAENLQEDDGGEGIYQTNQISQDMPIPMTYYTIDAARRIASNINGWHLPTKAEMETLITTVGGIDVVGLKLKSTNYWYSNDGGEDSYGLCVYPCGYAEEYHGNMNLYNTRTDSYLLTNTDSPYSSNQVYSLWFQYYNQSGNIENQVGGYGTYHTVRLIKD